MDIHRLMVEFRNRCLVPLPALSTTSRFDFELRPRFAAGSATACYHRRGFGPGTSGSDTVCRHGSASTVPADSVDGLKFRIRVETSDGGDLPDRA